MNLAPYLYPTLPTENVFGHRRKVEYLRASIDALRTPECPYLRILDAGCGSGHAVTRFLPRRGDLVLGIDMYAPAIDYAQRNFGGEDLRFVCANLSTLPQSEGEYDVVVLADVLEHLEDPLTVLSTAVARLAPHGLLLASIPNGRGPFEIESAVSRWPFIGKTLLKITDLAVALLNKTVLRGVWSRHIDGTPSDLPYNEESGHVQFFTQARFLALLASVGLYARKSRSLSLLGGPFTNYWFAPSKAFCAWNVAVVAKLPQWTASAWYFECERMALTPVEA